MTTDLRQLLDELTVDQPDPADDLERLITRGRRRGRIRTAAAGALCVTLAAGLTAGLLALRPGTGDLPAAAGTPSMRPIAETESTERSKALLQQLETLAPEIGRQPGAQLFDLELSASRPDGSPLRLIRAGSVWRYPVGGRQNIVDLTVEVGAAGDVPPVCDGMEPGVNRCTEVRHLPGGSTAYIHHGTAVGGHQYDVRLVRPDGLWVYVGSGAQMPPGSTHDALVGASRVLEIAQRITARP